VEPGASRWQAWSGTLQARLAGPDGWVIGLAATAWVFWLLGHVPGDLGTTAMLLWVAAGLAVGVVSPWIGLLLTVVVVPFLGGAAEFPVAEPLRAVPVLGAAARVIADRLVGRGPVTAPPAWVTVLAVVAALLWLGTFWTFMGIERVGLESLYFIGWIVGGPVAGTCAWIAASHAGAGRADELADVVLVALAVAVVIALLAWFSVPGVSLLTFPAAERGRLSALGFPTPTGMGLAVALPFAFAAAWRQRPWVAVALGLVVVTAIVLTESRGPLIALAAGATVGVWLLGRLDRRTGAILVVAGLVGLFAVMVARYGFSPTAIAEGAVSYLVSGGDADRVETWWAAVDVALRDPLTGGGWHALARWGDGSLAAGQTIQAHNVFLHAFAEGGFPLGIANGLVILYSASMAWRHRHDHEAYVIAAVVVFLVCGLWDIPQVRAYAPS
jgi:hypothetical protein